MNQAALQGGASDWRGGAGVGGRVPGVARAERSQPHMETILPDPQHLSHRQLSYLPPTPTPIPLTSLCSRAGTQRLGGHIT